jgi:hypothetical protein
MFIKVLYAGRVALPLQETEKRPPLSEGALTAYSSIELTKIYFNSFLSKRHKPTPDNRSCGDGLAL